MGSHQYTNQRGKRKNIIVLGAGVAGLKIIQELQKNLPNPWRLVLIEENIYHQYLHKIHEVCNINYNKKNIIIPLSHIIDLKKVDYKQETVISINRTSSERAQ